VGPVLAHLARGVNGPKEVRVTTLEKVSSLLSGLAGRGRLVLGGDGFPEEDIGFVRLFLADKPHWSLVVVARDAGARAARTLLRLDRASFLPAPLDMDQLRDLVRTPHFLEPPPWEGEGEEAEPDAPPPPRADRGGARPEPSPKAAPPAPRPGPEERELAPRDAQVWASAPLEAHVAALADIAQRLELTVAAGGDGDEAAAEVARLRRFTQMSRHVASPPARGDEELDAGGLFEERLAAITVENPKMRFLPRGERGHLVRTDREALTVAIDCVLDLARVCGAPDGLVKAPYESSALGRVLLQVEFPAGPLAGADVSTLLEPGAPGRLADRLPDYGPADLAAAAALFTSQGGSLQLRPAAGGRLLAVIELPLAD
jgi:hypothetical protein